MTFPVISLTPSQVAIIAGWTAGTGTITAQVNLRTGTEANLLALTTMGVGEVAVSTDKQTLVVRNAVSPDNYVFSPGAPGWTVGDQAFICPTSLNDGSDVTLLQALTQGQSGTGQIYSGAAIASGGFTLDVSAGPPNLGGLSGNGGGILLYCTADASTFTIASDGSGDYGIYSKSVVIVPGTPRLLMVCFDFQNGAIATFSLGSAI